MTVIDVRGVTRRASVLVVAVSLCAPSAAHAQGHAFGRVSASVEELYDSNLFATPESLQPQSDWVTRFGPLVEAGYRSLPLNFIAHYGFDAERHRTLVDLDEVFARQDFASVLNYRGRAVDLDVNGAYVNTHTPTELNVETLRFVGRAEAQRFDVSTALTIDTSAVTSLKLDHGFTRDSLEGGVDSAQQVGRIGIGRKMDARNTIRADYRPGYIRFSNGASELSHVATGGFAHQFTRLFDVELDAGARSTSGDIDPELSGVVRVRMQHAELGVRYARTRETTLGEASSIDVQRLGAELTYTPTRAFALSVAPARAQSVGSLSRDLVHVVDVQARMRATRRWTLLAVGRVGRQNRTAITNDVINYRSVSLRSTVTLGALEREDVETETP